MYSSPEVFKGIFESSAESIILVNSSGEIEVANPSAERVFGYEPNELKGKKLELLIPKRFKNDHANHINNYFNTPKQRAMGQGIELFGLKKNGEEFPLEVSLSYHEYEGKRLAIAFIVNITERKIAEQKLQQSEERLRYFVRNTPVSVAMTDCELRYILLSDSWLREFGNNNPELLGKEHATHFPNHQESWNAIYQKGLGGEIIKHENDLIINADGSQEWLRWEVHPWRNEENKIGGLIIFAEDITKRKIAEEALKKSRAKLKRYTTDLERSNRELEDFVYVASHDLQEPLRKIRTFGGRLNTTDKENLSERGQDYLNRMLNSAERMQTLIRDLLTYSRVTTKGLPFTELNTNKIVEEVISDLELSIEQTGAKLHIENLPNIYGDETQIRQLFQNLISNSIKFKKDNITPEITISYEKDEKYHIFLFKDNGIGFDEKYLDKIFHIFQRLEGKKYPGSGIGLSICKKIALRHNGDIIATSKLNEGATFMVKLARNNI